MNRVTFIKALFGLAALPLGIRKASAQAAFPLSNDGYLIVTALFASNNQWYQEGENVMIFRQTNANADPDKNLQWVCSQNTLYDFPDMFINQNIAYVELDGSNFPAPTF